MAVGQDRRPSGAATSGGFQRFASAHKDLLQCVAYNLYASRCVTSSSDHRVKVWDRNETTGTWTITDSWAAHDAQVTQVRWNGPLTGEHFGTIGEDGVFKLWQEDISQAMNSGRRWRKVFELNTPTVVPFMDFAFRNFRSESYLALTSRDGYITICEPEDHDDLSSWKTIWADWLCKTPSRMDETSFRMDWHKEPVPAWPAVVAGLDRKSLSLAVTIGTTVKVFRTDKDRKFFTAATLEGAKGLVRHVAWANGAMRGFDTLATASKDGFIRIYELHTPGASSLPTTSTGVPNGESQNPQSRFPATRPARSGIGAGLQGGLKGRREDGASVPGVVKQEAKLVAELEVRNAVPWRINWSAEGEVLILTCDNASVRLYKKSSDDKWMEAAEVEVG